MLFSTTVFALYITLGTSYYLPNNLRVLECGDTIKSSEVANLPNQTACEFTVLNRAGRILVLDFWSSQKIDFHEYCKSLKLVDEDEEEVDLCLTNRQTLSGSRYTLTRLDSTTPLEISVNYVRSEYKCPGRITHDLLETKFNVTNKAGGSCPFLIYSKGSLHCTLVRKDTEHNEEVTLEVRQGRHISRCFMSSGAISLPMDDVFHTQLFCGVHQLVLNGPPATVECIVKENPQKENNSALKLLTTCPI